MPFCDVSSNRVALVSVDPTFALLEVHRIGGQVPMDDRVAVLVEVEALLSH